MTWSIYLVQICNIYFVCKILTTTLVWCISINIIIWGPFNLYLQWCTHVHLNWRWLQNCDWKLLHFISGNPSRVAVFLVSFTLLFFSMVSCWCSVVIHTTALCSRHPTCRASPWTSLLTTQVRCKVHPKLNTKACVILLQLYTCSFECRILIAVEKKT